MGFDPKTEEPHPKSPHSMKTKKGERITSSAAAAPKACFTISISDAVIVIVTNLIYRSDFFL